MYFDGLEAFAKLQNLLKMTDLNIYASLPGENGLDYALWGLFVVSNEK